MKQALICLFALVALARPRKRPTSTRWRLDTLSARSINIPESKCTVKVYQVLLDDDTKIAKAEAEAARRELKAENDRMKAEDQRRRREEAAKTREEVAEWRDEVAQSCEAAEKHPDSPTLKQIYEGHIRRLQEAEERCQKLGCDCEEASDSLTVGCKMRFPCK